MTGDGPQRYADVSRSLLRDVVLRATDRLLAGRSWRAVTIAEVAREAGVSRQTVYNEFGNRSELALAYASWAGDQLLDEVERCVADHAGDLRGALVAAFTVFLDVGAEHPLIRSLGEPAGADDLVATLAGRDANPIITHAVERLTAIISGTWPGLPADQVLPAGEVLVRLAISHLLQPTGSADRAAAQVAVVLTPFIAALEGSAPGVDDAGRGHRRH